MKEGHFYSRVSVGTLSALDQNSLGCASLAESEGKAAFAWLTTFSNTWIGSLTPKASSAPDQASSSPFPENMLNQVRPSNLVGQLNSAGKSRGTILAEGNFENQHGTLSSSGIKLKPLDMLLQKEVRPLQPGFEVAGELIRGLDASQADGPPSNWAAVKLKDFLRYNKSKKAFWGSSFVLLVMSGVEIDTLSPEKAANILGVEARELEIEMKKVKNKEKTWTQRESLSRNTLLSIKSERCVSKLDDAAGNLYHCDHDYSSEERGVKRKASSWVSWKDDKEWITGEVVTHLLKRSFVMKDQFWILDDGKKPPVFVLRRSLPFYESNVMRVVEEIDEYCGFAELLMESREVQNLLKAAQNLDRQQMEGGGYALAPPYNYSRCMLEKKADYWETGLPALLLKDVNNGVMHAEIAACQLGVTTTMIRSALARKRLWASQGLRSGPVTVQRYTECGFGSEEDFWKESTTMEELKKVYKFCLFRFRCAKKTNNIPCWGTQ